eukprot:403359308
MSQPQNTSSQSKYSNPILTPKPVSHDSGKTSGFREVLEYKSQLAFLVIGIFGFIGLLKFIQEFNAIRQWMKLNHEAPDYGWAEFSDFKITLISAGISLVSNQIMNLITWPFFYAFCKEKNDEDLRKSKTLKACNSLYKGVYFISVTVWGFYVLKDTDYLPWTLLGKASYDNFNVGYPSVAWPAGMREYYLGTMGYHVHQLFQHALHPMRNDFVEMFLHHCVTLVLYGGSYMVGMTDAGSVIMFLHDWADVFTSFVRCFTETTITSISVVSAIGMTLSWFYTRIIVFPAIIYYTCFQRDIYNGAGFIADKFLGSFLVILFILHCYWFVILLKSIQKFVKVGKAEDLQQRVVAKKTK